MNVVLATLFDDLLRAAVIWISLILLAVVTLTGLVGRKRQDHPRLPAPTPAARRKGAQLKRTRLEGRAQELARYSVEIDTAADRAATMADRRRTEWLATLTAVETSWKAFDRADTRARRVILAAALPLPETPRTPSEYADRESYLHRAAMAACSHRELSALDLSDALAHRQGWDPRLHPFEQQVVLRRLARDGQRVTHQTAQSRERAAWQGVEVAAAAARSLRAEAFAAKEQAAAARQLAGPVVVAAAGRVRWDAPTQLMPVIVTRMA